MGKICLQKFATFCVDITFWYILTFNAKCCKLLTSSVFVVRFVNDIVELFCNNVFNWKGPKGQICLQKFTTFCVNITFV